MTEWLISCWAQVTRKLQSLRSQNMRSWGSSFWRDRALATASRDHSQNRPVMPSLQHTDATLESVIDAEPAFQNPETEWIDDPGDLRAADNENKPAQSQCFPWRFAHGGATAVFHGIADL